MAGREKNCSWHFADQPNGQEVGPNNAMEQNFKRYRFASLVRESIQNSLDAVLDKTKPVIVKYSFKDITGGLYNRFFEIQEHIKGCIQYYSRNPNAKEIYGSMLDWFDGNSLFHENLGYIRVSDYNTKGMKYKAGDTNSPFYAFVRSAGVSAKDDLQAGGSFGFGKAAYFLLSPISTVLVSTCTPNYEKYFEGISSLCTHLFRGKKKMAVGYYDDNEGLPIEDEANIPVAFRRDEPGTDINIMGFNVSEKATAMKEMVEAVLRFFWMAVFNEKLIVQIEDMTINKDNLNPLMLDYFPEEDDHTSKGNYYNPRPYYEAVSLYETGGKYIKLEKTLPLLDHVCLFLKKKKGVSDKIAYMRDLQMLVFAKRCKSNYGVYGVFYCDSLRGNEILRRLENPAHNEWKAGNWQTAGRTDQRGKDALQHLEDFIADSLSQVFSSKKNEAINIKGLEEFLYIPTSYDEDEDLEKESLVGEPTGKLQNEGASVTTDIPKTDDNPTIAPVNNSSSTGHVMINKTTTGVAATTGNLRSGHTDKPRKKTDGIQTPGDTKDKRNEDKEGETGVFVSPIDVPYRSFCQQEEGIMYHYLVLHSEESFSNVRLHFFSVGEESDEELLVAETNEGVINGSIIQDVKLQPGSMRLRIRFSDNMKHAVKLTAEEIYEL